MLFVFRVLSCVFLSLSFIVGLIGNALVCSAVRKGVNRRTTTNLILLNLAVADILGCLVNTPIMFVTFLLDFKGTILEKLSDVHFVLTVFIGLTICSCHLMLCVDRYDSVMSPFHRRITKEGMRRNSIVIWCVSLISSAVASGLVAAIPTHWLLLQDDEPHFMAGEVLNGVGTAVILLILFLMMFSFFKVKRGINAHNTNMINSLGQATLDREMRLTKVAVVLVAGFTVTCLPWVAVRLLYSIIGHQDKISYMISYSLLYMSHAINPIVYAGFIRQFQKAMKEDLVAFFRRIACCLSLDTAEEESQREHPRLSLAAVCPVHSSKTLNNYNQSQELQENPLRARTCHDPRVVSSDHHD